jgi:hypothetical protein
MEITTEWDDRGGDGYGASVDDEGDDALSSYDPSRNLDDTSSFLLEISSGAVF